MVGVESEPVVTPALASPGMALQRKLRDRQAHVVVLGLGYAGLPMAVELARAGFVVTGLDVDESRVALINGGQSPVSNVSDVDLASYRQSGKLRAASNVDVLAEADCALICVPTPLTPDRRPDLTFVRAAAQMVASSLHPGMLIVLQSTCSPGTTRQVLVPTLGEGSELILGSDYFVAFAPERIDPGNRKHTVVNTPKLVGSMTSRCGELAALFFSAFIEEILPVSSPEVAETAKLLENTFRFVNISLVNEMAMLCDRMGVNVWEVIEAASSKPFAFMPHYPGPGIGGHCIPVVPYFLEAMAREHGIETDVIAVSGRINHAMPGFVVDKLARLVGNAGTSLPEARILLLGLAYKADVSDVRDSPAVDVLRVLAAHGAQVRYNDPYVEQISLDGSKWESVPLDTDQLRSADCVVILTPHSRYDWGWIVANSRLVLDTRNVTKILAPVPSHVTLL